MDKAKFQRTIHRLREQNALLEREMAHPSDIEPKCSFCGESARDVKALIAGLGDVFICDECVALCQEVLSEERADGK